jgi:uncharacterized membrane protein
VGQNSRQNGEISLSTLEIIKGWLVLATEYAMTFIDTIALVIVVLGAIEAAVGGIALLGASDGRQTRIVWLRYSRWLVAALTFQLAADIIESSIAPSWDDVGRLASIAVVRTFLNYFLERDIGELRERQHEGAERPSS